MTASRIEYLFNRYVDNSCTPKEKAELMALLREPEHEATFKSLIQKVIENTGSEMKLPAEKANMILAGILQSDKSEVVPLKQRNPVFGPWLRVAAAVLLILSAGITYRLIQNKPATDSIKTVSVQKPELILPGTDKALLTMADGTTVVLDSVENGNLVQPGNATVQKKGAVLVYNAATSATGTAGVEFNTLSTPRGGQYRVVLSDGSQVWLNAASSLRFPTAFTGNVREVQLTGEAYFEVAKNKVKPFKVMVNGMQVDVLGTHFNINAYSEEDAIKTSLLEGSVRVMKGSLSNRLKPGEQAVLTRKDDNMDVTTADMEAVVAWKNGLFEFHGADIMTIMRQIARWYDVEIVSAAKIPTRRFEGKISRDAQLSDVLQILELSDIKFRVEGKKIIIQ
jgi:ferric-dicitrate binding protein FerR (iron transport regulator)